MKKLLTLALTVAASCSTASASDSLDKLVDAVISSKTSSLTNQSMHSTPLFTNTLSRDELDQLSQGIPKVRGDKSYTVRLSTPLADLQAILQSFLPGYEMFTITESRLSGSFYEGTIREALHVLRHPQPAASTFSILSIVSGASQNLEFQVEENKNPVAPQAAPAPGESKDTKALPAPNSEDLVERLMQEYKIRERTDIKPLTDAEMEALHKKYGTKLSSQPT